MPPGCLASYAHQWQALWARETNRVGGDSGHLSLPPTATNEERALAAAEDPPVRGAGLIVICARHASSAAALADACQFAGYGTQVVRENRDWQATSAVAVLWDTEPHQMVDRGRIKKLRDLAGGAPVLALVSFPRALDVRHAVEAGLAAVISKPFLLHDLAWHIDRATSDAARQPTRDRADA
jgi:DNA-binding NtrC family response regulator